MLAEQSRSFSDDAGRWVRVEGGEREVTRGLHAPAHTSWLSSVGRVELSPATHIAAPRPSSAMVYFGYKTPVVFSMWILFAVCFGERASATQTRPHVCEGVARPAQQPSRGREGSSMQVDGRRQAQTVALGRTVQRCRTVLQ